MAYVTSPEYQRYDRDGRTERLAAGTLAIKFPAHAARFIRIGAS